MTHLRTCADWLTALEVLPDEDLLEQLRELVGAEYHATARLVASLAVVDARRLYLGEGCASLYAYCTQKLHLSEHAAYGRVKAARVARRFPGIIDELAAGRLTLTAIVLLSPHLNGANHGQLVDAVRHRTRREIEEMLVRLRPEPPIEDLVRRLPGSGGESIVKSAGEAVPRLFFSIDPSDSGADPEEANGSNDGPLEFANAATGAGNEDESFDVSTTTPPLAAPVPARAAQATPPDSSRDAHFGPRPAAGRLTPLDEAVYKVQFTARAETYRRLMQVRELLRHQIPDGDLDAIFDRALALLYDRLARRKFAQVMRGDGTRPTASAEDHHDNPPASRAVAPRAAGLERFELTSRTPTRHIPADVRRAVWRRDRGRCTFVGRDGERCVERERLEFHHVTPFARGGPATIENIQLRCRSHNLYEEPEGFRGNSGGELS